jgi:ABC-type transporter Mla MlaB component
METTALFRIEGHFDVPAALQLRERTVEAESPALILDFSHAQQIDDATLALLTVNLVLLARRGYAVDLRGLREHQVRLLRHFGVALDGAGRVCISAEA